MDLKLLDKKIRDSGIFRYAICKAIGISRQELWNKTNGRTKFSKIQFEKMATVIKLSKKEKEMILNGDTLK